MTVNTSAAYGIYSRDTKLLHVMDTLIESGFDKEDICVIISPRHPIATFVREANILNAGRKESRATERFIGWLFEFGAVVIPTVGFFVRSQTFLHALVARKDSPILCGTTRALVGLVFLSLRRSNLRASFATQPSSCMWPAPRQPTRSGPSKYSAEQVPRIPHCWNKRRSLRPQFSREATHYPPSGDSQIS